MVASGVAELGNLLGCICLNYGDGMGRRKKKQNEDWKNGKNCNIQKQKTKIVLRRRERMER